MIKYGPPACFISHPWAKGYHHFAVRLAVAIEALGMEPWLDERMLRGGLEISGTIRRGMLQDCDILLFVVSEEALKSPHCEEELAFADESGMPVIGLDMDGSEPPESLRGGLMVDFKNPQFFQASLEQLGKDIRRNHQTVRMLELAEKGNERDSLEAIRLLGETSDGRSLRRMLTIAAREEDEVKRNLWAVSIGRVCLFSARLAGEARLFLEQLCQSDSEWVKKGAREGLAIASGGSPLHPKPSKEGI